MQDNLIYGVNPLIISRILYFESFRVGPHPFYLKYMNKKHPILSLFGMYKKDTFDYFSHPTVKIYGSNGEIVRIISCKSNDDAKQLKEELVKRLNDFLSSIKEYK